MSDWPLLSLVIFLPLAGAAFLSVHDRDKPGLLPVAKRLAGLGFELTATAGTADYLRGQGLASRTVRKVHDEERPHVVDHLINGEIALVINTPLGRESHEDDGIIRRTALKYDVPCITTLSGAMACAEGIAALRKDGLSVRALQEMGVEERSLARPTPEELLQRLRSHSKVDLSEPVVEAFTAEREGR